MKFVSIIMGSKSDYEVVYEAAKILNEFGASKQAKTHAALNFKSRASPTCSS